MRITILLPQLSLSGGVKIPLLYAAGLQSLGHSVTIVCGRHPTRTVRQRILDVFACRGRPGVHVPESGIHLMEFSRLDAEMVNELPPADVIIGTWWETVEVVDAAPRSKGIPVHFVQGHETYPYMPIDRVKATYRLPMHKIVVSQWLLDVMQTQYGASNVTCIPNPVDTDTFTYRARQRGSPPKIGTVFSLAPMKNSNLAIEAVGLARKKIPGLRLITFGPDRPPPAAFATGYFSNVLQPDQNIIPDIYRQCDYWLFTSHTEGFGLPILEAMAVGTPVIATPAGAAPWLVNDQTGALTGHNASEMAKAIVRLAAEPRTRWSEVSANCRLTAEAHGLPAATLKMERTLQQISAS